MTVEPEKIPCFSNTSWNLLLSVPQEIFKLTNQEMNSARKIYSYNTYCNVM